MTKDEERRLIEQHSAGKIGSHDVLRRLGATDYGAIIQLLAAYDLPFPRAPIEGREAQLAVLHEAVRRARLHDG
jgi:hypothetical protein